MDSYSNGVYYSLFMEAQRLFAYAPSFINMGRHLKFKF